MEQTKAMIKILHRLGIDDPDTIALFTPTVQFVIWILLGIGALIAVYEFRQRSQIFGYNETYTKIATVVACLVGGGVFLVFVAYAFAAIDSPIANSLQSLLQYAFSPLMILAGIACFLFIYDFAHWTHSDEGEEIKTWHKVIVGIAFVFIGLGCIVAGVGYWGKDFSDVRPIVNAPAETNPSKPSNVPVNPNDAQDNFDLGYKYFDNGEYEKAIDAYKKYIAENPQNAAAYYNLGLAYGYLEDHANAAENFRRATELDPQDAQAYSDLGLAYGKMNDLKNAVDAFRRATELNPQDANAYYMLGVAYRMLNDVESAAAAFRRATEIDPQNDVAYFKLALALRDLKRYDEAIQSIDRAVELNPQDQDYREIRDETINLRNGR